MDMSLYTGPVGEPEQGLIYQGLEHLSLSLSLPLSLEALRGNQKGRILYWDLEGYVMEGSGNEHLSP